MSLKIILLKRAVTRAVVHSSLVCALVALAFALGCGGGGGSERPILADSELVLVIDVPALFDSSEIPLAPLAEVFLATQNASSLDEWKEKLRDQFETNGFEPADSISASASVAGPNPFYSYISGGLDFATFRNKLDDDEWEKGEYNGFEVWNDKSNTSHTAILEDRELVVIGPEESIIGVLNAFVQGEGFADESSPLMRALDKTGGGLAIRASENCDDVIFRHPSVSLGCLAVAESFKGNSPGKAEIAGVYLFRDEYRAESRLDDIADIVYAIEDRVNEVSADVVFDELKADGEFVTYRATIIYE